MLFYCKYHLGKNSGSQALSQGSQGKWNRDVSKDIAAPNAD